MKRQMIGPTGWLCLLLTLPLSPAFSQTNPTPTIPDRFLLVLDVSAPMRPRAAAVQEAITGMLASSLRGELKNGDQIGIWTYNDQLHTGEFGLVDWQENKRNEITRQVLDFVQSQRYENQTRFDVVQKDLGAVVSESKRITIILISDGDEVFRGTPFDTVIAKYYQENAAVLKDRKVPIITVLRGYKGHLIGHRISYPPWPMDFPPFPPEPKPEPEPVVEAVTPQPTNPLPNDLSRTLVTTNRGPVVFAEPLIVSGKAQANRTAEAPSVSTNTLVVETTNGSSPPVAPSATGSTLIVVAPSNAPVRSEPAPTPDGSPAAPGGETSQSFWTPTKLMVPAAVIVVVLGGLFLFRRKPPPRRHTSLITRSMSGRRRR